MRCDLSVKKEQSGGGVEDWEEIKGFFFLKKKETEQ